MFEFLNSNKSLYWALFLVGLVILAIRFYMVRYFTRNAKIRTVLTTGKIVSFYKDDDCEGGPVYYPIIEFRALSQTQTIRSSLGQFNDKMPEYAQSGDVMVRYNPLNPSDADQDSPKLLRLQEVYTTYMLFLALALIAVASWKIF